MLHSLQYYACCYALLCLMHQQQRAASLTIIIDGATTNEWATQDEYKRMLEASEQLELALSQQQQQPDQLEYQQDLDQPPPEPPQSSALLAATTATKPSAPASASIRRLTERGSAPVQICGRPLMDTLELVCGGRFYNGANLGDLVSGEAKIAEPIIKAKRASRSRALPLPSSFQSPPAEASSSSSSSSLSSSALKHHHHNQQPPIYRSEGGDYSSSNGEENYPGEGGGRAADERNRLHQLQMQLQAAQLPAHLTIGGHTQHNGSGGGRQFGQQTDSNNDGDTITITNTNNNNNDNINPLTNRPRNKYNRMILSRRARGASEECCKRPCEMEVLESYCAKPTK